MGMRSKFKETGGLTVRLPQPLREWVIEQTVRYASTLNSEIIRCVTERMERARNTSSLKSN
jgi:hypothetical protein